MTDFRYLHSSNVVQRPHLVAAVPHLVTAVTQIILITVPTPAIARLTNMGRSLTAVIIKVTTAVYGYAFHALIGTNIARNMN